jgi:NAD(P)-dependent dehydrogenase (short-subunit alcohol dehydrogenase family)
MGRLAGKVAVITGGASGIGKATALRFLSEGASVVALDLNQFNGESLLDESREAGFESTLRFVAGDTSKEKEVASAIGEAVSHFGRLDILFNNAGVGGAFGPITDITEDAWDYTFAVNCRGIFFGIKHGARVMIAQGEGGSIINTASISALTGDSGTQAYSASKAAVVNLTKATAVELGRHRIRVNAICPGAILTPLLHRGRTKVDVARAMDEVQPWPDHGEPEDVAGVAVFFASDDSKFVTGEDLLVDGGLLAAGPRLNDRLSQFVKTPEDTIGISRGSTGEGPTIHKLEDEGREWVGRRR